MTFTIFFFKKKINRKEEEEVEKSMLDKAVHTLVTIYTSFLFFFFLFFPHFAGDFVYRKFTSLRYKISSSSSQVGSSLKVTHIIFGGRLKINKICLCKITCPLSFI